VLTTLFHALCGPVPEAMLEATAPGPRLVQTCHTCGAREAQTLTRDALERLVAVLRDETAFVESVRTAEAQLQRPVLRSTMIQLVSVLGGKLWFVCGRAVCAGTSANDGRPQLRRIGDSSADGRLSVSPVLHSSIALAQGGDRAADRSSVAGRASGAGGGLRRARGKPRAQWADLTAVGSGAYAAGSRLVHQAAIVAAAGATACRCSTPARSVRTARTAHTGCESPRTCSPTRTMRRAGSRADRDDVRAGMEPESRRDRQGGRPT
jgi:hypothetical protein